MIILTKKARFLTITLILIGCSIILWRLSTIQEFFSEEKKKSIIGKGRTVRRMFARPIVPHLALPLRNQTHTWIVGVPLKPFKAPLITLPPVDKLPSFILYKPEYLTPVRNQGDCGACWAFSVCDVLADRAVIQTGGVYNQNLSVQQLMSCFDRKGCEGGSPEDACFWLEETQFPLVTARKMPYIASNGGYVDTKCKKSKRDPLIRVKNGSVHSLVEFIPEEDYDEKILKRNILNMKRALVESGPFFCALSVYDDLFTFTGTKVYSRGKDAALVGGHAIEIIGYTDKGVDKRDGFKEAHWICRNSWGKEWPTESAMVGYFAVRMGVNMCGIESRCGYVDPVLEASYSKKDYKKALTLKEMRYTSIKDYLN